MKHKLLCAIAFLLACAASAHASDHMAHDVHLKGLLGGKLKIEMLLEASREAGFFRSGAEDVFEVEGVYYYRTQLKPIRLRGTVDLVHKTFFLNHEEGNKVLERFVGKIDPANRELTGTWTLESSGKQMPFVLSSTAVSASTAHERSLAHWLAAYLTGEPDAEGASIEDAVWTARGVEILGFEPSWSGDVTFFSPLRLEYYTGYNSTARSSYYETTLQVIPATQGRVLLLVAELSSHIDKGYENEQGEWEGFSSNCDGQIEAYELIDDQWEVVTDAVFPPGTHNAFGSSAEGEEVSCGLVVLSDAVLLPDGKKLYWNGRAFAPQ